jgi:hypothetical protein
MTLSTEADWVSCFEACSDVANEEQSIEANQLIRRELLEHPERVLFFAATVLLNAGCPQAPATSPLLPLPRASSRAILKSCADCAKAGNARPTGPQRRQIVP